MKTRRLYLLLALIGIVLPYSQLVPWIADNGLNIGLLVQQIAESRIAAFGWLDVLVSALALFIITRAVRKHANGKLAFLEDC